MHCRVYMFAHYFGGHFIKRQIILKCSVFEYFTTAFSMEDLLKGEIQTKTQSSTYRMNGIKWINMKKHENASKVNEYACSF